MLQMGLVQGSTRPGCFKHGDWGVEVVSDGDDLTVLGHDASLDTYESALAEHFEIRLKGRLSHEDTDASTCVSLIVCSD